MLVSASDPSAVIKLSDRESRNRSEIWREGPECQINSCMLGTFPALGGGSLQSYLPKGCGEGGVGGRKSSFSKIAFEIHKQAKLELKSGGYYQG